MGSWHRGSTVRGQEWKRLKYAWSTLQCVRLENCGRTHANGVQRGSLDTIGSRPLRQSTWSQVDAGHYNKVEQGGGEAG